MTRKRDLWLWNPELLKPVVIFSILITLIAIIICIPIIGQESLYLLFFGLIGPLLGLTYGIVGKKVRALKNSLSTETGYIEESLIVINKTQSPGIAILSKQKLRLIPIVGKEVSFDIDKIKSIRKTHSFNGKSLIWKSWLVLSTNPRLGFALPESVTEKWFRSIKRYTKKTCFLMEK